MLGLSTFAKSLFGSANERKIKPLWGTVAKINALEPRFQPMSDEVSCMADCLDDGSETCDSCAADCLEQGSGGARVASGD